MNSQRKVTVTILKTANNGDAQMVTNGFTPTVSTNANGFVRADTSSVKIFKYAYTKEFEAGEVVIPNSMANRAYFVIFSYAPWGGFDAEGGDEPVVPPVEPDEPVETALVKTIKVDGNAIANFDAETLTYDVTLTDNQMAASAYPNVTAELNDTEASVNVTEPTSFPGSVNVTVTKGEETKTYTINYKTPAIDIALTADAPTNTPKPEIAYGAKVGDLNFKDRTTFGIIAVNDEDITEDTLRIKTCIGWQTDNNSYSKFYASGRINDWLSFTAPRTMVVTVYEDNQNNTNLFDYWTTETSSTPYIEAAASNSLKYNVKHRRVFEAGDKVELPNARGGRTFTATINYVGWDEEYLEAWVD